MGWLIFKLKPFLNSQICIRAFCIDVFSLEVYWWYRAEELWSSCSYMMMLYDGEWSNYLHAFTRKTKYLIFCSLFVRIHPWEEDSVIFRYTIHKNVNTCYWWDTISFPKFEFPFLQILCRGNISKEFEINWLSKPKIPFFCDSILPVILTP